MQKENTYKLEIGSLNQNQSDIVTTLIKSFLSRDFNWSYEINIYKETLDFIVIEKEDDIYFDYINFFLDFIETYDDKLTQIGIIKEKIIIWKLYQYIGQCNMEWNAIKLKRMGENGISLCVSCWEG